MHFSFLSLYENLLDQRNNILSYSQQVHLTEHAGYDTFQTFSEIASRWNSALNLINEGLMIINGNNVIIQYNKYISKLTLFPVSDSIIGFDYHRVFPPALVSLLDQKEEFSNEILTLSEQNMVIAVSKRKILLYGNIWEYMISIEDVTAIQKKEHEIRLKQTTRGLTAKYFFHDIVGESHQLKECITIAEKAAQTELAVLITGESGVGKELFAQSIHNASIRQKAPFVAINCAALPADLLESEFFGYEEGAFTG